MRLWTLILLVGSVNLAFGQKAKVPTEIDCAVMPGHKVNIKEATVKKNFVDYKGRRYFFCCGGCPKTFNSNPAKYAKAPSIKVPRTPKKSGG